MIVKRFAFEFVDFYLYLFYIGLYKLDLRSLRTNLVSLFIIDEIRRVALEGKICYLTSINFSFNAIYSLEKRKS